MYIYMFVCACMCVLNLLNLSTLRNGKVRDKKFKSFKTNI